MILIGQFDSPFVRRVAIALRMYGIAFEHRPWSVFGDAEKIRPYNPLIRVPTLVLPGGEVLIESHSILDYLDSLVAPERVLFPRGEPARRRALKVAALATGVGEKAVSLFYEQRLHSATSDVWVQRCRSQIAATLGVLELDRAGRDQPYWFGADPGHADIAVTVVIRFLNEAHPGLVDMKFFPTLAEHAGQMEALSVFREIQQRFAPPAG
ncbi:MAG: glutathione S-transferase family protein [Burkholderiales bacterium]|nr:glutathione S-transferase family protein [Burkholderiales bacterium]